MTFERFLAIPAMGLACALFATPAWAIYTNLTFTGGGAQEISTVTITLPDTGTVTAKKTDGGFTVDIPTQPGTGTQGTAVITDTNGETRTVPVTMGENGTLIVDLGNTTESNCFFAGFCGTLGVDYAHFSPSSGSDGNEWGFSAAGTVPINDSNLKVELDGGYHHVSSSGVGLNNWNGGGSLYYYDSDFRGGATLGYQQSSSSGFTVDAFNYGGFVDWIGSQFFTASAKGGGFSLNQHLGNGYYVGGALTGFVMPDLGITGAIDHTHFGSFGGGDENDYTIGGEYLISETTPVSIYGGYTYSGFSPGSFHVDTFFVGLRVYCDDGAQTLVDRQHTGTLGWSQTFTPLQLKF